MTVDLNEVAAAAIETLQTAIHNLNALKHQPNADVAGIEIQIEALEQKQTDVQALTLGAIENSPQTAAALTAINAAAANMKAEAANITAAATALGKAQQVIGYATTLISALAAFA